MSFAVAYVIFPSSVLASGVTFLPGYLDASSGSFTSDGAKITSASLP